MQTDWGTRPVPVAPVGVPPTGLPWRLRVLAVNTPLAHPIKGQKLSSAFAPRTPRGCAPAHVKEPRVWLPIMAVL